MIRTNLRNGWTLKHGISTVMENVMPYTGEMNTLSLPHDAMIGRKRSANALSGPGEGFFEHENIEYNLKFFVPEDEADKVHYLNFDGIYMNASILINGLYVAKHTCGYTPFTLRIDEYLSFGAENVIRVQLRDLAAPFARWYAGNGIYREASILTGNPVHIEHDGIHISTVTCDSDMAVLHADVRIKNETASGKEIYAKLTVCDQNGEPVTECNVRCYISANDAITMHKRLEIDTPRLWDAMTPDLYTCKCELLDQETGAALDLDEIPFGIRSLQLDSRRGMRVNGSSIKLKGGCIHHDNGVLGSVSVPDIEVRKIQKLKEAGYNAVRTAHNPPSKALLDACDQVGMYVILEITDCWTDPKGVYDYGNHMPETWEQDIEDLIKRDFNHPSIVMWSIGNEIPEIGNPVSNKWGRKFVDKIRQLDPTRFVTNGINVMMACLPNIEKLLPIVLESADEKTLKGGINDMMNDMEGLMNMFSRHPVTAKLTEEACEMLDLVGYNYSADRYEAEHEWYPERVFFGSETSPSALDINWELVEKHPYVIGDFVWTAWDYLGEAGIGRTVLEKDYEMYMGGYPWIAAYCADFDLSGYRKPISYWREIIWGGRNHKPYIAVHSPRRYGETFFWGMWSWTDSFRSWSFQGFEGAKTAIEVYSDADEIELFINGESLGKKPVGDDFKQYYCKWETTYQPGEIKAVAYKNHSIVGEDWLRTVETSQMAITVSRSELRADTNDLCIIEVELRDQNGTLDLFADRKVSFETEGPIELWGAGSADPETEETYHDPEHRFFGGRVMAVIRAGQSTGEARVTIRSGEELQTAAVFVK